MSTYGTGQGSYVGIAQKAGPNGFGGTIVNTGLKTFPCLSANFTPNANRGKRRSIATALQRISQTYPVMNSAQIGWTTEYVSDPTAWKPALLWAFGKRVNSGTTPNYLDTYNVTIPAFDAGADSAPTYYNHTITAHAFISDGTNIVGKHVVDDVVCTEFKWAASANGSTSMSFRGTGRNADDSAAAGGFTDQAGSIMSHNQLQQGANSGIYFDTSSPPTTPLVCDDFEFTLTRPHLFEAQLGGASGNTMRYPVPSDIPSAAIRLVMAYEDLATGTDAKQIMTDFKNAVAQGMLITSYVSANDYIQLRCHGSVDPIAWTSPNITWSPTGRVKFEVVGELLPDTITDLALIVGTSSNA